MTKYIVTNSQIDIIAENLKDPQADKFVSVLQIAHEVGGADLGILLANWGGPGPGDLDHNGIVGGSDVGILLGNWG